jgi:hypothetical protein
MIRIIPHRVIRHVVPASLHYHPQSREVCDRALWNRFSAAMNAYWSSLTFFNHQNFLVCHFVRRFEGETRQNNQI